MTPARLLSTVLLFSAATFAVRADVTETLSRTYSLPADGIVQLHNINGDITIVAWDRNEVSLEAVKRGRDDDDLKRISIDIDTQPDQLTVKTTIAKSPANWLPGTSSRAAVRYELRVPVQARLERISSVNSSIKVEGVRGVVNLETVNGSIRATGLAADAELESVNGSIAAEFTSLDAVRTADLQSVNGRIDISVPKGANARVETRSTNGRTSIDQAIKLDASSRRRLSGEIGSGGGPLLKARTTNGSVAIRES
ncbi:hypothetical protein MASR2M8_01190 [Opitutaceae bacterium]